jgi:hypothetical protein
VKLAKYIVALVLLVAYQLGIAQSLNYSNDKLWLALPNKADNADAVPNYNDRVDKQATAVADVFYIHPTTYFGGASRNDRFRKPSVKRIAKSVMLSQASAFNQCYKIYAPRYRQVSLKILRENNQETDKALDFAYADVKLAFDYYLKNYNHGRPFAIAAHSQGSYHAIRLIKDFIDGDSLVNQLVAAYIGGHVVMKVQMDSVFSKVNYCNTAEATGCLLNWQTLGNDGYYQDMIDHANVFYKGENIAATGERLCVNPVSWNTDSAMVDKVNHLGSVKLASRKKELKVVMVNYLDTKVQNGFVYIDKPKGKLFNATGKNYHIYDYNLFYLNISANACQRLDAWLAAH